MKKSVKDKDTENAAKIEAAIADPAEWQKLAKPFRLSGDNEKFLGGIRIVCRENTLPKSAFDRKIHSLHFAATCQSGVIVGSHFGVRIRFQENQ